jgi:hypothetical protein
MMQVGLKVDRLPGRERDRRIGPRPADRLTGDGGTNSVVGGPARTRLRAAAERHARRRHGGTTGTRRRLGFPV